MLSVFLYCGIFPSAKTSESNPKQINRKKRPKEELQQKNVFEYNPKRCFISTFMALETNKSENSRPSSQVYKFIAKKYDIISIFQNES